MNPEKQMIDELKRLMAEATPLPWKEDPEWDDIMHGEDWVVETTGDTKPEDLTLIVAAVNALPALLEEVEKGYERIAEARYIIEQYWPMVRNLTWGTPVRTVSELEKQAAKFLAETLPPAPTSDDAREG